MSEPTLPIFNFTLVLGGVTELTEDLETAVYGGGIDDALLGISADGQGFLEFDREAASLQDAVLSAIRDVWRAGIAVTRLTPEDVVTATEIAERTGRSRQSINQLATGERGPGGFPAPVGETGRTRIWRWSEVVAWFHEAGVDPSLDLERARLIRVVNALLELSREGDYAGQLAQRLYAACPQRFPIIWAPSLENEPVVLWRQPEQRAEPVGRKRLRSRHHARSSCRRWSPTIPGETHERL
ncbi:MAG: DNA-binding protein [Alphaproteobacteria bacterium]|nr:DNA-binding protein [Alphaproteobacteria bacterium]